MSRPRTAGIVAEYNPFHNGHLFHLRETVERTGASCVVAVMSGCFTQRGEPAAADKWVRAAAAVENGIDLVLELPFIYACNSAESFARGAIRLLDRLGCIDSFSFGSEAGDLAPLIGTARLLQTESPAFRAALADRTGQGLSFPAAREAAVTDCYGPAHATVLRSPNNILGVEYLKEWLALGSSMQPLTFLRKGAPHNAAQGEGTIRSASAIRRLLREPDGMDRAAAFMPTASETMIFQSLPNGKRIDQQLFNLIIYKIMNTPPNQIAGLHAAGEGLENRLTAAVERATDLDNLVRRIKTKRYTESRIRRLLLHLLLDLQRTDFKRMEDRGTLYARVLGFSPAGASLLSHMRRSGCSSIPVLTNINRQGRDDPWLREVLSYDIRAAALYHLLCGHDLGKSSDHRQKPHRRIEMGLVDG